MADFVILSGIRGDAPRDAEGRRLPEQKAEIYLPGEEDDYLEIEKPSEETLGRLKRSGAIYFPEKSSRRGRRRKQVAEEVTEDAEVPAKGKAKAAA